jgi:hypothetical protein
MNYGSPYWGRGSNKLRDGTRRITTDVDHWRKALSGHIKDAHKGKFVETCNGCRELQTRINETGMERV